MRLYKAILVVLVTGIILVSLPGCSSDTDEGEQIENQIATVQRGGISLEITAAGNLALSHTEDLAVDLFYGQSGTTGTKGTIGEVLVEEGDTVEEGQVLVIVDKDEWADQLSALEDLVTSKERALIDAEIALIQAEQSLKSAQDSQATKEAAVLTAQVNLDQAQRNLNTGIASTDYESAKAALDKANAWYEYVQESPRYSDAEDYLLALERAEEQLQIAQTHHDNVLSGYDSSEIAIKRKQVEAAKISLTLAEGALEDVAKNIALAELQLTRKQGSVTDAEKALADTQEDLEDALNKSPEITAPFAGFVTQVYVEGGDEVVNGTIAAQIADPDKFEADIMVSEMDILQIQLGTEAWVDVDAMQGMSLPADVTHISPTATIQSGVVNYSVKVEIKSMEAVMREGQEQIMADIAAGEIPAPLQRAIDEGRLTREQVEEMIEQGPPAGMEPPEGMEFPEGFAPPSGLGESATGQLSTAIPEDFQLREGLTVTVSIIVDESIDVLLVPNAAITAENGQSYVQVVTESGETEKQLIQTGLNDYQFTEVTEGLSENEQILVPQGTVTVVSEEDERPRGMMMFGGPPPR